MQRLEVWRRLKRTCVGVLVFASVFAGALCGRAAAADAGWVSLFDGKSLKNWEGNLDFWRVEDGTITGQTTKDHMVKGNTFLIWDGETKGDFELTADFKLIGGNSGIQYRSYELPGHRWVVAGYQADMDGADNYTGCIYGERFRGMLCPRGDKTVIGSDHKPKVVSQLGDSKEIASHIKHEEWNTYHITGAVFIWSSGSTAC